MPPARTLTTLVAVILSIAVSGCGNDAEPPQTFGIGDLVADAPENELVSVSGTAYPIDDEWFAVGDGGASVWVHADQQDVAVVPRQRVTVVGRVQRFTPEQANELADLVADTDIPGGRAARIVVRARRKQGDPLIEKQALRAAP